jgi:hypothetical protein
MFGEVTRQHLPQRQVETVEPHHRTIAFIAVIVPFPRRREHHVAAFHHDLLAFDRREAAFALDDETQRERRVPVRARRFARQNRLDARVERIRRVGRLEVRVDQHEHAAFGEVGADQARGAFAERAQLVVAPHVRRGLGDRERRRDRAQQGPKRLGVLDHGLLEELFEAILLLDDGHERSPVAQVGVCWT